VANIRRSTRAKYHRAIRYFKQNDQLARFTRMGEYFVNQGRDDFWTEVQKMRGNNSATPTIVDDCLSEDDIALCFREKYNTLYNSVGYVPEEMARLRQEIEANACRHEGEMCPSHVLSVRDVTIAVSNLKRGKHDGHLGHYSDHLRFAPNRFLCCLSLTLNSLLVHGLVPDEMALSTVSPIPKNKRKSLNDSDNYRAIALSSIIGKMLDRVLIEKCSALSDTSDLQFGFKARHSTNQCSFVAREIIEYYHSRDSDVYITLLDASKAFDRVEYTALFRILISKSVCPIVARFLLNLYTQQQIRVRWGASHTDSFASSNGVKQGGVLSPLLFSLYLDPLLRQLESSAFGCWIGFQYCGALAYADDVVLIAPTLRAVKEQLKVCAQYAQTYQVSFNATKSKLIPLCRNDPLTSTAFSVSLMDEPIECAAQDKHLGNVIGFFNEEEVIDNVIKDFNKRVGMIRSHFKWLAPDCAYHLFKSFCMPLYGSVLWNFSHRSVNRFYTAWRKAIRCILHLHPRSHSCFLAPVCNDVDVEIQLLCRNVRFLRSLERSNNRVVRCCFQLVQNGSRSTVSRSFSKLCDVTQKSRHHIVESVCHPTALFKIGNDYEEMAGLVRDLLALRAGLELDQNLSAHDIELLRDINFSIRELCTH
jgi:hypothetical protein